MLPIYGATPMFRYFITEDIGGEAVALLCHLYDKNTAKIWL